MLSQLTNLSRIKELQPRTDSPWKRQIPLGQVSLLSFLESSRFWAIWRALRYHDDYVLRAQHECSSL